MIFCRYIIVNILHKGENKDYNNNNNNNNNNCKIAAVKLKKKGVRIFQTLSHIPPIYPWEPTKWNGPVNCNEPDGTACETENSCN